MYAIIQKRKLWYTISGLLLAAAVSFLFLGGLRLGTDFTGGTLLQLSFSSDAPSTAEVNAIATEANIGSVHVQTGEGNRLLLRSRTLTDEERESFFVKVQEAYPAATIDSTATVGSTIGTELRRKAVIAILLVLVAIVLYLKWAFRKASGAFSSWAYGMNALIALVHDVVLTVGFFAVLGYFFGVEIDAMFITALLTVLGFSVHDTIVVLDRVRERFRRSHGEDVETLINQSVNDTLVRSINTSLTTIIVLVALYLFGGHSIRYFVLALIFGITVGTYSSIFVASPLLLLWSRRQ